MLMIMMKNKLIFYFLYNVIIVWKTSLNKDTFWMDMMEMGCKEKKHDF